MCNRASGTIYNPESSSPHFMHGYNILGSFPTPDYIYLQQRNTKTFHRLPLVVVPMFPLHVAVTVSPLDESKYVRVGVVVELFHMRLEPGLGIKHF